MKKWKSKNLLRALEGLADTSDPNELEKISREAPLPKIREVAAQRRESIIQVQQMSKNDAKCPKCGNPLVNVEYFSAVKGKATVTNVDVNYQSMKKTTNYVTPYSNFHRHTAVFCTYCAHRKVNRKRTIGIVMALAGLALVATSFMLPLPSWSNGVAMWNVLIIISGIITAFAGIGSIRRFKGIDYVKKGKPLLISNGSFSKSDEMHDYISSLYVLITPLKDIQKSAGANVVVGRGMVRNKNT